MAGWVERQENRQKSCINIYYTKQSKLELSGSVGSEVGRLSQTFRCQWKQNLPTFVDMKALKPLVTWLDLPLLSIFGLDHQSQGAGACPRCIQAKEGYPRHQLNLGPYLSIWGLDTLLKGAPVPLLQAALEPNSPFLSPDPYRLNHHHPCYLLLISTTISK